MAYRLMCALVIIFATHCSGIEIHASMALGFVLWILVRNKAYLVTDDCASVGVSLDSPVTHSPMPSNQTATSVPSWTSINQTATYAPSWTSTDLYPATTGTVLNSTDTNGTFYSNTTLSHKPEGLLTDAATPTNRTPAAVPTCLEPGVVWPSPSDSAFPCRLAPSLSTTLPSANITAPPEIGSASGLRLNVWSRCIVIVVGIYFCL